MSRTASHREASANMSTRFFSALSGAVPISATEIGSKGLPAASATVSAVNVLPTPGGPINR